MLHKYTAIFTFNNRYIDFDISDQFLFRLTLGFVKVKSEIIVKVYFATCFQTLNSIKSNNENKLQFHKKISWKSRFEITRAPE